jgi:O-antigen ligase
VPVFGLWQFTEINQMSQKLKVDRQVGRSGQLLWPLLVTAFVVLLTLSGGLSIPKDWVSLAQSGLSLVVLAWALFRLAVFGFPTRLAIWGSILAAAAIALVLLQLAPLPPSVWQLFPGRDLVLRNYVLLGETPGWAPLSLSPGNTAADGIAMLPAIAMFLAVQTLTLRHVFWICAGIVVCAIVSVGLGLLQHAYGPDSGYYLYDSVGGTGVGTFNNRNFFAAQLYSSIPILSAFAVAAQSYWRLKSTLVVLAGVIYAAIILAGLSLSDSRTGILLAMPAVLFAVILTYSRSNGAQRVSSATMGVLALLLGLLVVGQASMVGLLRLTQIDPLTDYRTIIAKNSFDLALQQFPVGAGFGSFVPLYQLYETPETMRPEFVNHGHNDWLELAIEGGAPALFLLAMFVLWYFACLIRVWRYGQGGQTAHFPRMASLVVPLLLFHSMVDFPLRTPALMVLFALCCGVMVLQPEIASETFSAPKRGKTAVAPSTMERKPFQRPKAGFGAGKFAAPEAPDRDNLQ